MPRLRRAVQPPQGRIHTASAGFAGAGSAGSHRGSCNTMAVRQSRLQAAQFRRADREDRVAPCQADQPVRELAHCIGHAAGGRAAERLLRRLGIPHSDDTILRLLKREAARRTVCRIRVAGIDDWSWQRGRSYATIVVDLERRQVVDVLPDRSAETAGKWQQHPGIEVVSRDRCGLYAQAARLGAPHAKQVADRFHLLQNLRETIERQLSRSAKHRSRQNWIWQRLKRHWRSQPWPPTGTLEAPALRCPGTPCGVAGAL